MYDFKDELIDTIIGKSGKIHSLSLSRLKDTNPELFSKLDSIEVVPDRNKDLSKKVYLVLNDLKEEPKCEKCKDVVPRFISNMQGYREFCSNPKCCFTKSGSVAKTKETKKHNIEKEKLDFKEGYGKHVLISKEECISFIELRDKETESGMKHQWVNRKHLRENRDVLYSILDHTKDILPVDHIDYMWSERFYNLIHDIIEKQYCSCGKESIYVNYKEGYSGFCGKRCVYIKYHTNIFKNIEEQGFNILNKNEVVKLGVNKTRVNLKCSKCEKEILKDLSDGKSKYIHCEGCYGDIGTSKEEEYLVEYIKTIYSGNIETQKKIGDTQKKYDIFIPEHNLAIEYDGIYWHSSTDKNNKFKHSSRMDISESLGHTCFRIISSEWHDDIKRNKWKSIINNKLGYNERLFARKCAVFEITKEEKSIFLHENHFQGDDQSKVYFGLYHNDSLVSVMTFGNPRFSKKYEWELIRFCSLSGFNVVGGASKLLKAFERKYNPNNLVSYSDRRRTNGGVYLKLGFDFIRNSTPNYFYYKGDDFLTRYQCQKHKLSRILEKFDPLLTEYQNMFNNGYRVYFDCGNKVFIKTYK